MKKILTTALCPLSLVLAFAFPATAQVFINEVQSSVDTTILDEFGENSDWIELYNDGDEEVDLSGWGISDKVKKPFKGLIPAGTKIAAKGYLLLFADGIGEGKTEVHVAISLGADGDSLFLKDPSENLIDSIQFGAIPCDCSFGRVGDGGKEFKWFAEPTPGKANDKTPYEAPLGKVAFSQERGVFTGSTSFSVGLSYTNGEEGVTIYYTTDHSDPTTSSTEYTGTPITVSKTTIIRATAVKDGHLPYRNVVSHSYIYLDQVIDQAKPSIAPTTWKDISKLDDEKLAVGLIKEAGFNGTCTASYTVDKTNVLKTDQNKADFVAALQKAPIVSVTMSDMDLFNDDASKGQYGIYTKPATLNDKPEGTRPASVEWVTGNHVLCSDVGFSVHGDGSRHFDYTPKKSFKLKFRGRYGANKLEAPVMDDVGYEQDEFKTLVLRAESNHSWTHTDSYSRGTSMHDQFLRNVQGDMTGFHSRGTWVHLFINGLYWGLYNLCESFDNNYCEAQWGGEKLLWDVVTGSDLVKESCEARDGTIDDYLALFKEIKDLSASDVSNCYATACQKIDLDNFIDYMLMEWWCANTDWPQKNWTAMLSTKLGEPMRLGLWDVDQSMGSTTENRVTAGPKANNTWNQGMFDNNIIYLERALEKSSEYKLRFADRVHKHFYNDGVMTSDALVARYATMAERVRPIVYAELARWGTYRSRWVTMETWDKEYENLTTSYFPNRWTSLKTHLKDQGLYPSIEAAEFTASGDKKTATLSIPSGTGITVYYTTDGSDPREAFTGAIRGQTYTSGQTIEATSSEPVKARARKSDGTWSALSEVQLIPPHNAFCGKGKDQFWNVNENWLLNRWPNGAGEEAIIGAPTADDVSKKNKRKIAVTEDTTVGFLRIENGEYINVIENGDPVGDFSFCGAIELDETTGAAVTNGAELIVTDAATAGHAEIGLGKKGVIRLESDLTVAVSNTVGDADCGGLLIEGGIAGNGHNLKKTGPGRLTLSCANAADAAAIDKLQCEGGIVAIEKPLTVGSITKTGPVWLMMGGADIEEAVQAAVVCTGKLSADAVGLFVDTDLGGAPVYGGAVAVESVTKPKKCTVYIPDAEGTIRFCDKSWKVCADAKVEALDAVSETDNRKTYKVTVPYLKPLVTMGDQAFYSIQEALDAANSTNELVFAVEPVVDGRTITANGDSGAVKDYYDVVQDGNTLTLKLNEKVQPDKVTINFVTWNKGQQTYEEKLGVTTQVGFYYAYGKDGVSATEWVAGDGTPQPLEPPAGDGWEILVSDVEPK